MSFSLSSLLRINVKYLFKDAEANILYAEGNTTLVMVNRKTDKPVRIPDELMSRLVSN
ncbi:MAG TPA: hypothetical protein ENH59_01195 [Bacteroidetes bacterium]|nr:hypothetical protein [Bacteroidota bacterium]